ncbi:hypothetical protein AB0O52_17505 [Arthrobacter sp. NPDC080073]|uniref:hypothetical protein n=1 Tax=Arthrobacter sp. NPDC080073 TaxID=3155919 RepID=UPI00343A7011
MNSDHWNALSTLIATAVVLLGSFLQMMTRASDFKEKQQQSGRSLTRLADIINDRASITVAIGAGLAYCFAAGTFVWVWGFGFDAPALSILIFGAIAVLFLITLYYALRVWKIRDGVRMPTP